MNHTDFEIYNAPAAAIAWSSWSSKGVVLATASDKTMMVWDPKTKERRFIDTDNQVPVSCVAFSNGGLLASAVGNVITVRSADEAWDKIIRIENASSDVSALDFCCYHELTRCARPLLVYGTAEGSVAVFDVNSRKTVVKTVHQSQVNSVKWMSFPHSSIVSASDGKIVELAFSDSAFQLQETSSRKAVSARKASTLLNAPYQPSGGVGGVPNPSIIKNDQKVGLITKHRKMDYRAIGASALSAAKHKIEYSIAEGKLATAESGGQIQAISWVGDSPCNFATGDEFGEIVLWSIKVRRRHLIGWIKPNRISLEIDPVASIKAHGDAVTAIAYPPIRRSVTGHPWLMASASRDAMVKLWDIESIRESLSDYELRRFSACVGISTTSDISRHDISVTPEYLLKRTLVGLAAQKK